MAKLETDIVVPSSFHSNLDFTIHDWKKKFECKTLEFADLRSFWARNVPPIYSPKIDCDCLNVAHDEALAGQVLYGPLERFICDSSIPEKVFSELQNMNNPPSLCGRVFKIQEPTYSCRDCGLDPTCVLCVDCFKNSAHRNHRYKMSMSGGGGYCDCGDEEAWKSDAYCESHSQGKSQNLTNSCPLDRMPPDLIERTKFIFRVVLQYCYQMLTWEHAINLPQDLASTTKEHEIPDTYSTVLFNDEVHTYEQVIQTLGRAISCSQKEAIDYATTIDREGRSIVKCSTFNACNHVRNAIERITSRHGNRPLKVVVMHTDVIAHQFFSMRLLSWLQKVVSFTEGFRVIFSSVMMEHMEPMSLDCPLVESVMLSDTQLWKSARNQWHQLFISGMLMDQQCKKTFAKVFTKNYPALIKDFIADDHEHSVSVTSLSVQIFTVPTLAHYLIMENNAIFILLRTFLTECERNRNEDGKLAFERNQLHVSFRRAQYVLYDLKYVLTVKPQAWNEVMRKCYLTGINSLFILLSWMQGMDSVVRQVGQHVEFEAEWESGINLQLKLTSVITLVQDWCGSDRNIFVRAIRKVLQILESVQGKMICVGRELADHSASCIDYDVSSMPVTIHLPLSRIVAGLLLHLEKFGLTYDSPELSFPNKPSPEQLMELPLRTLVMVAQFRSGMWRRNGYSLLNQVYFFHNVRLRDEMFDKDIVMLQVAASMIESNEFLIHLLNKYGLLNWARDSFTGTHRKPEDDHTRQTLTVAEEFLGLVLIIVSERYVLGVGNISESDKIKKDIIQLLCIESMPHSQLYKMLPKDPNYETGMEEVINEVALFKKPPGSGTGKYELKPEYYKEFNPFFYHYTREEQSKAEEAQLKRRKQAGEECCCPPPLPVEFCSSFTMVINVLQCDVMLHIFKVVLERTINLQCTSFSDTQFEKILHLIGMALLEEERLLKRSSENSFFNFCERATKKGIYSLLEECINVARIESQKDLLKWVLKTFKAVQHFKNRGLGTSPVVEVNPADSESGESSKKEKNKSAQEAAARKARIMAQMTAMQNSFLRENAALFKEVELEDSANISGSQQDLSCEACFDEPIALGNKQQRKVINNKTYTCILCREDQELSASGRALVLAAFVQRSTVLSKNRKHVMKDPENYEALMFPADLFSGPHTSTCGHVMHSDCWQKFFDSVLVKERRQPLRISRHASFDVDKNEFLCPLCERLSNSVIPLVPPISVLISEEENEGKDCSSSDEISIDNWLAGILGAVGKICISLQVTDNGEGNVHKIQQHQKPIPIIEAVAGLPPDIAKQFISLFDEYKTIRSNVVYSDSLIEMMKLFSQATYTVGLNLHPNAEDNRIPAMSWWSCSYTIHAIEWLLREQGKPLFGELSSRNSNCLEAIIRFAGACMRVFNQEVVRTQCVKMLRFLLVGDNYLSSRQCCLELDAFAVLVFLSLSSPVLFEPEDLHKLLPFPRGNVLDCHILHLIFVLHLVQLLLTYFTEEDTMETDWDDDECAENSETVIAVHFYKELLCAAGMKQGTPVPSGHSILHCLKFGSLPFLRCAAIFFHFITDVSVPQNLQENAEHEFENLCNYLGLPCHFGNLLQSSSIKQLALSWARHPRVIHLLKQSQNPSAQANQDNEVENLVRHPLSVNRLVNLSLDYSELINNVSLFTCPNSDGDDSRSPTMCLVCGTILCSESYCCQTEVDGTMVGACTHHAHFCGEGVGIFLRIRDCKVLLMAGKTKGCYLPPPYVDDYGETDQGLLRGNPLHLCTEKYQELHHLWLSHGIPEKIAHELEQPFSLVFNNWELL